MDKTRFLRRLIVHESIRQWLILQRAFEPQSWETAAIFGSDRQTALAQLQARLRRLAEWQKEHGESTAIRSGAAKTAE